MVESGTHIKTTDSSTSKHQCINLFAHRQTTHLPTEKRKFSFFAYTLLKRKKSYTHYSTLPCAHSPPNKAKSNNFYP